MSEQFRNFLNPDTEHTSEKQEDVLLENPENVPEVSDKYREVRCFETLQDDDHIWSDVFAMSQDFTGVIYKAGSSGRTLKNYNRRSGNIRTAENEENQYLFQDVKLLKDGESFATVVGDNLQIRDAKTLEEKQSLEITPAIAGNQYDQTPDLRKIVFNGRGTDVAIFDLETNDKVVIPNDRHYSVPADALLCLRDSKFAVLGFDKDIELLDIEAGQYTETLSGHNGRVKVLVESNDGKQIISGSSTGEIKFWDKDTLKVAKEIEVKTMMDGMPRSQPIDFIKESRDSAHVIVCGGGRIKIINKETGQVVREIAGTKFFESSNGVLSVMNDEEIEFWTWGIDQEDKPNESIIHNGKKISEKDRFEEFTSTQGETVKGISWHFYENLEAQRLSEQKRFEWGNERIYFEIPLDQLTKLRDLAIKAVKDAHIPVTFKYVDVEASSQEMIEKDVTRFVVNFTSVEDARKFYEILSGNPKYKTIQPDRSVDYLAHNIDGKAFYAQGFRELREYDRNQILESLKEYTQNPNRSYSRPSNEGGVVTISQEEYEKLVANADINGLLKKTWENK